MRANAGDDVTVTLDGEPVQVFVSADSDAGWVRVSVDEVRRGRVIITPRQAGLLPRVSRFGRQ